MNYIQLKESVIKLTDSLKVLPKEDKVIIENLIKKYQIELSKLCNFDPKNNVFDKKELRSINRRISNVIRKYINKYDELIERLDWSLYCKLGGEDNEAKWNETYDRLKIIFKKRYGGDNIHFIDFHDKFTLFIKKSRIMSKYNAINKKHCEIIDSYYKTNKELINLVKKRDLYSKMKESFDIDLELKNYIAYYYNSNLDKSLDRVASEAINLEVEKQFITHKNKFES